MVILSINTDDENNEYLDLSISELKNDSAKPYSSDKSDFNNIAYSNIHNIKDNKVFNANIKNNASNANADDAASNIDIKENSNIEKPLILKQA